MPSISADTLQMDAPINSAFIFVIGLDSFQFWGRTLSFFVWVLQSLRADLCVHSSGWECNGKEWNGMEEITRKRKNGAHGHNNRSSSSKMYLWFCLLTLSFTCNLIELSPLFRLNQSALSLWTVRFRSCFSFSFISLFHSFSTIERYVLWCMCVYVYTKYDLQKYFFWR